MHTPEEMSPKEDCNDLESQAEAWVVRMHSGHFSPEDARQLEDWLAQDRVHRDALQQSLQLWNKLPSALNQNPAPRRVPLALAASAAMLVCVLTIEYAWHSSSRNAPIAVNAARQYQTAKGERSTVKLDDGSTVEMSTDTQIIVEYSPARRRIILKRGQVFASVAKDIQRPFEVEAMNGTTRALGTEFDVQIESDVITVADLSGRVSVGPNAHSANSWFFLEPGFGIRYDSNGNQGVPFRIDSDAISAWRSGYWSFENTPLQVVVRTIQRHHTIGIQFENEQIAALTLTGRFKVGDLDTLFKTITHTHAVNVRKQSDKTFFIFSK